MTRRRNLRAATAFAPDDNASSYQPDHDPRNTAADVRLVALRDIYPSPHQVRLVADAEADRELAEDLDRNGLIHPPVATPHPSIPGAVVLAGGHRRYERSCDLARAGRGRLYLRQPAAGGADPGEWRMPIRVLELSARRAHAITISENLARKDLRPWEQAKALRRHQELLKRAGEQASVRAVAASLGLFRGTVAPYLQVGRALHAGVILKAGIDAATADTMLCELPLETLLRVTRAKTVTARAAALRRESHKAGVLPAASESDVPACGPAPATDPLLRATGTQGPLQINIRQPIEELPPARALRYLEKLMPALVAMAERLGAGHGSQLKRHLVAAQEEVTAMRTERPAPPKPHHT